MLAELTEKLREKFNYSENHIHAVVADIRKYAEHIDITENLRVVQADPDDDKFVECAIVGHASYIISSDNHLLGLGEFQTIKILSPEEYLSRFAR